VLVRAERKGKRVTENPRHRAVLRSMWEREKRPLNPRRSGRCLSPKRKFPERGRKWLLPHQRGLSPMRKKKETISPGGEVTIIISPEKIGTVTLEREKIAPLRRRRERGDEEHQKGRTSVKHLSFKSASKGSCKNKKRDSLQGESSYLVSSEGSSAEGGIFYCCIQREEKV